MRRLKPIRAEVPAELFGSLTLSAPQFAQYQSKLGQLIYTRGLTVLDTDPPDLADPQVGAEISVGVTFKPLAAKSRVRDASGLLNGALVWAAYQWTSSTRLAAAPLFAFLATVFALLFFGAAWVAKKYAEIMAARKPRVTGRTPS